MLSSLIQTFSAHYAVVKKKPPPLKLTSSESNAQTLWALSPVQIYSNYKAEHCVCYYSNFK